MPYYESGGSDIDYEIGFHNNNNIYENNNNNNKKNENNESTVINIPNINNINININKNNNENNNENNININKYNINNTPSINQNNLICPNNYKIFYDKGKIIKHKVKLVARGFSQVYDIDYIDTFLPTL